MNPFAKPSRLVAAGSALLLPVVLGLSTVTASAAVAPVGQGFTVTPSDLKYILAQIKIAERHTRTLNENPNDPCASLLGTGPDQIASPLISKGLRTVDGSCNNLIPKQGMYGAADQVFPRLSTSAYADAEPITESFPVGAPGPSSYAQKAGGVVDSEPRMISNLIVDQTSTNPAAIAAAGYPVRTQGNDGVVPCKTPPVLDPVTKLPVPCVPEFETLFVPNVTTDVGLSPPFNSLFTIFGQFFDHGIDQTVKGGSGTVYIPLKPDDPLIAGKDHILVDDPDTTATDEAADNLPPHLQFMVLSRGKNQPGKDGKLGTTDDLQETMNTDSPWVDQSQTYASHPSHQVFLREFVLDAGVLDNPDTATINETAAPSPVATGKMLGGADGGQATWAMVKKQAAELLGLALVDADVTNVPMLAADPYGKFEPGPNGLPQYLTKSGKIEGNLLSPVPVPADVLYFETPFLTDIAHNADPSPRTDHSTSPPTTVVPGPDDDDIASADWAKQPAGTYDEEMLNAHFAAGDGRVNENIGLTAIHQVFHSEHDRVVKDIENTISTSDQFTTAQRNEWHLSAADGGGADGWNGERIFQAARFVTEMEYQHLVFEEFARKVQPAIEPFQPFAFIQTEINPAIKAEFAHAVYRFGHSMLTEDINRTNEDGSKNNITLLNAFLNPPEYTNGGNGRTLTSKEAAGSLIMGMSDQVGSELDEFVTETLRNNLLGLPLDLAAINITRARSEGIPSLNNFRREVSASTGQPQPQLKPYVNWIDFGENLKNPESLINFVAAYGQHSTILFANAGADGVWGTVGDNGPATLASRREAARLIVNPDVLDPTDVPPADAAAFMNSIGAWANTGTTSVTGVDNIDLWVGGLAEMTSLNGGLLGTTFNYVFESQLTDLQNGDRLYYLARTPGMNLRAQLEGNSFAELIMRNTNAHTLKADVFATADCKFELKNLAGTKAGFDAPGGGNIVANDPASECNETLLLIRMPDGTIKYRNRNTVDPAGINGQSVYNGTDPVAGVGDGVDRIYGGNDTDTFWGGLGDDIIEGGDGADVALGGEGDDIITDMGGDDILKGGPGNDAIDAGPGLDIIMGGEGKDFTNGGLQINITFAGADDDFVMLGQGQDEAFGDGGDDWLEGGDMPDLMIGDSGNLFFLDDSQRPGHDILIGQGNDDDYDMEGGDDIGVGGPGIEKVAGGSGFDWEIGQGDPQPQDADLALPIVGDILTVGVRDKFNEAEALSGWKFDDKLRGTDLAPATIGGGGFIGCDVLDQAGLDRIDGLDAIVPTLNTAANTVIAASASKDCPLLTPDTNVWGDGDILLGGAGSDLIEGRGADDIIDGDRYVSVRLSVRTDPKDPTSEIGSASVEGPGQSAMTSQYLHVGGGSTGAFVADSPTLQQAVFAGNVNPGNIVAVREIITPTAAETKDDVDTAVFSGPEANYLVDTDIGTMGSPGSTTTVRDNVGTNNGNGNVTDGTDTLRNIERLQFADSVPPGAPINVTAVAGNASATVGFTGVGEATDNFSVLVVDADGVQVGDLRPATAGATSLKVTGLTNWTAVRFQVKAANSKGFGAFSALSNAVTPIPPVVTGAARMTQAPVAGVSSVMVKWLAPLPVVNAGPITGYSIRTFVGANTEPLRTTAVGKVTSELIETLTNGTEYEFDVAAVNEAGTGAPSSRWKATPRTVADAPVIGAATAGIARVTVRWTAPKVNGGAPVTGYSVRAFEGTELALTQPITGNVASGEITLLTNGTTYTFDVAAVNAAGTGARSARTAAMTPRGEFAAPTMGVTVPAASARGVSQHGNLSATFSEAIIGYNATTVRLTRVSNGSVVPMRYAFNPTTLGLIMNPETTTGANIILNADTQYRVTITGGSTAVRDESGNPMATRTWTFTTGPAPTITATTPRSGATGVRRNGSLNATFSEAITGWSAANVRITRVSNGVAVPLRLAFNSTTRNLIINPETAKRVNVTLAANVQYRVTITGGTTNVRDKAGNPLVTRTWLFKTGGSL
jgi:hypothetical protein